VGRIKEMGDHSLLTPPPLKQHQDEHSLVFA